MKDKPVAIITGASRGIGRAITIALAAEGFDIVAVAKTIENDNINLLKEEVEKFGSEFLPIDLDIADTKLYTDAISIINNHFGRIDLLVNNAGVRPYHRVDLLELTEESFDRVIDINLKGTFFFSQKIAQSMLWCKEIMTSTYNPQIIFISSVSAELSSIDRGEYCISKAGVGMVAKLFADRLEKNHINVYDVRPGFVWTDMTQKSRAKYEEAIKEGNFPIADWAQPEDIAKAVASLARGEWRFSTGSIFEIAGGMNIHRLV